MTIDQVKEQLPNVRVRCGANTVARCQVSGRLNNLATVMIPCGTPGHHMICKFSWQAVARAVTHGIPLTI